jgi:hypothetical protein
MAVRSEWNILGPDHVSVRERQRLQDPQPGLMQVAFAQNYARTAWPGEWICKKANALRNFDPSFRRKTSAQQEVV